MVTRLGPGSPAPASPAEVEALLRMVPVVAFFPELEAVMPAPLGPGPLTPHNVASSVHAAWLARVVDALRSLEARARAQSDGGLRFLAVTLRHFLRADGSASDEPSASEQRVAPAEHPLQPTEHPLTEHPLPPAEHPLPPAEHPLPPAEHPLVVALCARTNAQRHARPDHPNEVARVLDGW